MSLYDLPIPCMYSGNYLWGRGEGGGGGELILDNNIRLESVPIEGMPY